MLYAQNHTDESLQFSQGSNKEIEVVFARMSQNILELLGQKLGVDRKVISKATELSELLDVRANTTSLSALRLTGSCRHVICIDLAAKGFGCTLNIVNIVKLSGMNKKSYSESVKAIASILDLEEHMTIRELAVQFGCPGTVNLATDTLHRYVSCQCGDIDFGAPMFMCAAIIVACRKLKLKIDTSKLKELSGAKKATLDRLIAQLGKHVDQPAAKRQKLTSKKRGLMEAIEAHNQEDDKKAKKQKLEDEVETGGDNDKKTSTVDYEEWKRRILAKAALSS